MGVGCRRGRRGGDPVTRRLGHRWLPSGAGRADHGRARTVLAVLGGEEHCVMLAGVEQLPVLVAGIARGLVDARGHRARGGAWGRVGHRVWLCRHEGSPDKVDVGVVELAGAAVRSRSRVRRARRQRGSLSGSTHCLRGHDRTGIQ